MARRVFCAICAPARPARARQSCGVRPRMRSVVATLLGKRLRVGDRVRLFGGYEAEPRWLGGETERRGRVVAFLAKEGAEPAAVVELDTPIQVDEHRGSLAILHLRYSEARWARREVVHIELSDAMPEQEGSLTRPLGQWVESHASYEAIST
jgi:hypothetical protein